ncbi:MAG: ABC transporter substrate-binding protein [Firmicutes bacterium]|jgi:peptide/nickel transport system substrate-binding protein|nr:ABC transporter substrate-binding protein [Bacillota bacterium]
MKARWIVLAVVVSLVLGSTAVLAAERNQTLIVGGGTWSQATSWNPLYPNCANGIRGLVYETLFAYSPLTNEHKPWLAESGGWISDKLYEVKLRRNIYFSDGQPLTAADVVFTYELARDNELTYTPLWRNLREVKAVDNYTVQFIFDSPNYQEWQIELYTRDILPKHIWENVPGEDLMVITNDDPVGSGPYKKLLAGPDRNVWVRDDNWWGNAVFGQPKPVEIVDMIIYENNVALGMLMQRTLDLSNYFIPGVPAIKDLYGLTTWYDGPPYMISANVAMLVLNSQRKPLDDAKFRRALAFAVNPEIIVERVFERMVPVSDSTGLFGGWTEYRDAQVAEEYGFWYDPDLAKQMLADAGYVDKNGDGWIDMPDGSPIDFEIIVPSGWTDWMESIRIIAEAFRAIGINANPAFPDAGLYDERIQTGDFDMCINNYGTGISGSPFSYWNWVANHNINRTHVTEGNYGRYDNQELFDLIYKFNQLPPLSDESLAVASEIQKILLVEMPAIPFWLNGMWAQSTSQYWTNWPTADNPVGYPCSWANNWQFGTVEMLINLQPAQ